MVAANGLTGMEKSVLMQDEESQIPVVGKRGVASIGTSVASKQACFLRFVTEDDRS